MSSKSIGAHKRTNTYAITFLISVNRLSLMPMPNPFNLNLLDDMLNLTGNMLNNDHISQPKPKCKPKCKPKVLYSSLSRLYHLHVSRCELTSEVG